MLNRRNAQQTEIKTSVTPTSRVYIVASDGNIGCAIKDNEGNTSNWEAEYPYGNSKLSCTANVLHEVNGILDEIKNTNVYPGNFVFALYENIYNIITNLEILTKQLMFNKAFVSHTKESEETIPEICTWKTRELSPELEQEYKAFLTNVVALLGRVTFVNSKYISNKKDTQWKSLRTIAFSAIEEDEEDEENTDEE